MALRPASKRNPCPICGRQDGDCRISDNGEQVICHHGSSHHPPTGLRSGEVITGKDGNPWASVGITSDGRGSVFVAHVDSGAIQGARPSRPPQPIALAVLPQPAATPPASWPHGQVLAYSSTQQVRVNSADGRKAFYCHHLNGSGTWEKGSGPSPWPLWGHSDAVTHAAGQWVLEAEGEKCAEWFRAAGRVAISQPGHAHTLDAIAARYRALVQAGVAGVVYVSDNDSTGSEKAEKCRQAAASAGLSFRAISAADIWPDLPAGGSVDDAPGSPADRLAAVVRAIPKAQPRPQQPLPAGDRKSKLTKGELQQFIRDHCPVEFNELTRTVELSGRDMGSNLSLADQFLAHSFDLDIPKEMAVGAFEYVALANPYNPVRRYLESLRRRSDLQLVPMADLARAFGIAPDDLLSQALLARHLAAAVRRGITPGYKHDQVLILAGQQGARKSSAIEALASSPWFDSATRVEELEARDFLARINGCWLFEFDEIEHTLLKRTASEFKGFLSRRVDSYVEKYQRSAEKHPRRAVAFGTTNEAEFLNDNTGNRRAWVIDIGDRPLDPDWIRDHRDAIWATVLTWVDWGQATFIANDDLLQGMAAARAGQNQLSEPLAEPLAEFLSSRRPEPIAQSDLIWQALRIEPKDIDRGTQMTVSRVVRGSEFRTHGGTVRWKAGKKRWVGRDNPVATYFPLPVGSRALPNGPSPLGDADLAAAFAGEPWADPDLQQLFQARPGGPISGQAPAASSAQAEASRSNVSGDPVPTVPSFSLEEKERDPGARPWSAVEHGESSPEIDGTVGTPRDPSRTSRSQDAPTGARLDLGTGSTEKSTQVSPNAPLDVSPGAAFVAEPQRCQTSTDTVAPLPAGAPPLPAPGALVEVRDNTADPWRPGYRVLRVAAHTVSLQPPHTRAPIRLPIAGLGTTWRCAA